MFSPGLCSRLQLSFVCVCVSCREVKYLYDGDCAMCRSLKAVLGRQDNRQGLISFIDISDPYYDPLAVSETESGKESESGGRAYNTAGCRLCQKRNFVSCFPVLWFLCS